MPFAAFSSPSSRAATLLDVAATPTDSRALRAAQCAGAVVFVTALTAAAARISFPMPLTPVPFTIQPMIVLLGSAALGARRGLAAQVLYLALGVAGLPVFAASPLLPEGLLRLLGPTGGYLMSYPFAAWLTGLLAERGLDRRYGTSVLAMMCGLGVVFACGVGWLSLVAAPSLRAALAAGFFPFVLADVLKILVAAAVMPGLWWLSGRRAN